MTLAPVTDQTRKISHSCLHGVPAASNVLLNFIHSPAELEGEEGTPVLSASDWLRSRTPSSEIRNIQANTITDIAVEETVIQAQ